MRNNIILIGFMGSGKTTIGKRLSQRLCRTMIDTDSWIEQKQGRVISEIFGGEGEAFFRQLETQCLETLLADQSNRIISTGGGLPMKEENRSLLKQMGMVVYLKVSAGEVMKRLEGDTTRPLLKNSNPYETAKGLLEKREPVYEQAAHIVIDTTGKEAEEITEEIIVCVQKGANYENISH